MKRRRPAYRSNWWCAVFAACVPAFPGFRRTSASKSHGASAGSRADHGREPQGYRAELAVIAGWVVNAYEGREGRGALQSAQSFHDESEFVRPWKVAQGIIAAPPHAPYGASAIVIRDL